VQRARIQPEVFDSLVLHRTARSSQSPNVSPGRPSNWISSSTTKTLALSLSLLCAFESSGVHLTTSGPPPPSTHRLAAALSSAPPSASPPPNGTAGRAQSLSLHAPPNSTGRQLHARFHRTSRCTLSVLFLSRKLAGQDVDVVYHHLLLHPTLLRGRPCMSLVTSVPPTNAADDQQPSSLVRYGS
jgi:hypothetical protein